MGENEQEGQLIYGIILLATCNTGYPQGQPIHPCSRIYCLVVAKAMRCCEPCAHVYIGGLHCNILGQDPPC